MRLFIAIEPDRSACAEILEFQKLLMQYGRGNFTNPDNFHLTLNFLGETKMLAEATKAMTEAVRGIRPFTLQLSGYGYFMRGNTRTAFVAASDSSGELRKLNESLTAGLLQMGFAVDTRPLKPHITIGREVDYDISRESFLKSKAFHSRFGVSSITLFESARINGRIVYNPLFKAGF